MHTNSFKKSGICLQHLNIRFFFLIHLDIVIKDAANIFYYPELGITVNFASTYIEKEKNASNFFYF